MSNPGGTKEQTGSHNFVFIHVGIKLERDDEHNFGMQPYRAAWLPLLEETATEWRGGSQLDQGIRTAAVDIVLSSRKQLTREKIRQTNKSLSTFHKNCVKRKKRHFFFLYTVCTICKLYRQTQERSVCKC